MGLGRDAGGKSFLLDAVPATMLASAVAFIAAVAPVDLVERVVVRSGLPRLVPAAAPPLGFTARALMTAGSFCAVLVVMWLVLHLAGRRDPGRAIGQGRGEPRIRRADRHPDAPARRPLLAAADLGAVTPAPSNDALQFDEAARPPVRGDRQTIADLLDLLETRLGGAGGFAEPGRFAGEG